MFVREFKFLLFTGLLWLARSSVADDHLPKVNTSLGGIRGYYKISEYGKLYAAYEGIPYAEPPVGELRFEPPVPVKPWLGELPATKLSFRCLQYGHVPIWFPPRDKVSGSEDCLYLNIYVPDREDGAKPKLPVLLWIHGGAFMFGSADDYGERYVMNKNIIFVTLNYRVGPLGFLSTEDGVVPGNMGLKDQNLALKWVRENIHNFGGDPSKITLAGVSAGGASVHYHYFSPLSAGLFQNGISMSGTALNCWAQTEAPLQKAKQLGAFVGCPTDGTKDLVACLKQRPARSIVDAVGNFMPWLYSPFSPFGPVVEKSGDRPFIDRSPVEMLATGDVQDVPWLTSVTSSEGLYPASEFIENAKLIKELDEGWSKILPHLLDFNYTIPIEKHAEVSKKIREHYLADDSTDNEADIKNLIRMVGDRLFNVDAEKAAKMQAKANQSPVLFYYYDYRAYNSLSDLFSGSRLDFGVSHGDDGFLIFENRLIEPSDSVNENDEAMRNNLLHILVSFMNDEAVESVMEDFHQTWNRVYPDVEILDYLHFKAPGHMKMHTRQNFAEKNFWSTIKFAENVLPQDNVVSSKKVNDRDEL